MQKLVELLNEFENEEADTNIRYWSYYQNGFHLLEYGQTYSEMLIISKKYEFIEWLVENEKIDLDKIKLFSIFNESWYYNAYQSLLMALSISDTPIDDLISYLK